jgi:hypothetical protein
MLMVHLVIAAVLAISRTDDAHGENQTEVPQAGGYVAFVRIGQKGQDWFGQRRGSGFVRCSMAWAHSD